MATLYNGTVDETGEEITAVDHSIIGILADAPVIVSMNLGSPDQFVDVKGLYHDQTGEFRMVGVGLKVRARNGTVNILVTDDQ